MKILIGFWRKSFLLLLLFASNPMRLIAFIPSMSKTQLKSNASTHTFLRSVSGSSSYSPKSNWYYSMGWFLWMRNASYNLTNCSSSIMSSRPSSPSFEFASYGFIDGGVFINLDYYNACSIESGVNKDVGLVNMNLSCSLGHLTRSYSWSSTGLNMLLFKKS